MQGVFTKRLCIDTWEFKPADGTSFRVSFYSGENPILVSIIYTLCFAMTDKTRIIDGKRKWDKTIHDMYFADMPFRDPFDPSMLKKHSMTIDNERWLKFDVDFHFKRIVPHTSGKEILPLVREQNYAHLLYNVGGVNPLVFARHCNDKNLQMDAVMLDKLTHLTKIHRKVWLETHEYIHLLIDDAATKQMVQRLQKEEQIVLCEKTNRLGLFWAVSALKRVDVSNASFMHRQGCVPIEAKGIEAKGIETKGIEAKGIEAKGIEAKGKIIGRVEVDFNMAIDEFVDRRQLATTMLSSTWNNYSPVTCTPIACLKMNEVNIALCDLEALEKPVVVASRLANIRVRQIYGKTCLLDSKVVYAKRKLDDLSVYLVNGKKKATSDVLTHARPFSCICFNELSLVVSSEVVLVLVFEYPEDLRWFPCNFKGEKRVIYLGMNSQ